MDELTCWSCLPKELRLRTTPEDFCAWLRRFSGYESEEIVNDDERETTYCDRLVELIERSYVRMYTMCERLCLPLLSDHQGALPALQELLAVESSDSLEDEEDNDQDYDDCDDLGSN